MSAVTLDQALQIGQQALAAGQLAQAESVCRDILAAFPEQAGALHLLGGVAIQANQPELALDFLRRSCTAEPGNPSTHAHLGELLARLDQREEAAACFERALALRPDDPDALNNLGVIHLRSGRNVEARASFARALGLRPAFAAAHDNLGTVLHGSGRLEEAAAHFEQAVRHDPNFAPAYKHLGYVLAETQRPRQACAAFERALHLQPTDPELHNNFGASLAVLHQYERARDHFARAFELRPDDFQALDNLGLVYRKLEQTREARACFERALALRPGYGSALNNLASVYRSLGQTARALEFSRLAVAAEPTLARFGSDLVLAAYYHPEFGREEIQAELARWNERHVAPLAPLRRSHANRRDPARRLKVGYVSSDFQIHVTSHFTVPLLEAHDPAQVETHAYASVVTPDVVTARLRAAAHVWHDVATLSDAQLAEQIRADGIDLLVDLAMHTGKNCLPLFGYRPAPVQVAWLAYAGSTGVETMDYRLTDWLMDPAGSDESWSSEKPLRLPNTWCCFDPLYDSPPVAPPPALRNGFVTFGSLNNFVKINAPTLRRWAGALRAVPNSRLLLHASETEAREFAAGVLAEEGIEAGRLEFVGRQFRDEYLQTYARIDVGLDPFPFNGMTTTCDALWMGVPVLCLPGDLPSSRAGLSLLRTVGLDAWVATDEADYRRKAAELTGNSSKLFQWRMNLRRRMQASPLMDKRCFARNVEAAYRQAWQDWCGREV